MNDAQAVHHARQLIAEAGHGAANQLDLGGGEVRTVLWEDRFRFRGVQDRLYIRQEFVGVSGAAEQPPLLRLVQRTRARHLGLPATAVAGSQGGAAHRQGFPRSEGTPIEENPS